MRFGLFEFTVMFLLIAGLLWSINELRKKPSSPTWEAQKRELEELRHRLAELQTSKRITQ